MSKSSKKYDELLNQLHEVTKTHYQIREETENLKKIHKQELELKCAIITDLQSKLVITEKALQMACETLQDINFKLYNTEMNFDDYFKQQAKEMLENE